MHLIYALGYVLGCHRNYREYVAGSLADERIEQQLEEWLAVG